MTNTIIIAVLFVYMVYSIYKAFVIFRKHKQALSAFQKDHPNAKLFDSSKTWTLSSGAMGILSFVMAGFMDHMTKAGAEEVLRYRILYVVIGLIFITMIFSSLAGKRMWFSEDGFFFGDRFFKFKDIDRKEPLGGIGSHSLRLVMKDSYAIQINKKMDEKIDSEVKLWKAKKKLKK